MEENKIVQINQKIATKVVKGYEKIENAVVNKYQNIEDKFVDCFLRQEDETVSEAKARLVKEQAKRQQEKNKDKR